METAEIEQLKSFDMLPRHLRVLRALEPYADPQIAIAEVISPELTELAEGYPMLSPWLTSEQSDQLTIQWAHSEAGVEYELISQLHDLLKTFPNMTIAKSQYVHELGLSNLIKFDAELEDGDSIWDIDGLWRMIHSSENALSTGETRMLLENGATVLRKPFTIHGVFERLWRRVALTALENEELETKASERIISETAAIFMGLQTGKPVNKRLANRKNLERAIVSAEKQGVSAQTFLKKSGYNITELVDASDKLDEEWRKSVVYKVGAFVAAISVGIIMLHSPETVTNKFISPATPHVEAAIPSQTSSPIDLTSNRTLNTPIAQPKFDQVHYGSRHKFIIKNGQQWGDIVAEVQRQSGDPYDEATLKLFNGIETLQAGNVVRYTDCPKHVGALVIAGYRQDQFAYRHGLTLTELESLNGGNFRNYAGTCARVDKG
jgi:hypothetical protein